MQPRPMALRGLRPSRVSQLCCVPLLGALLALGAPSARAATLVIRSTWKGPVPIVVGPGDTLIIVDGGSVSSTDAYTPAIDVEGGSVRISAGSVSNYSYAAIFVGSGSVDLSGGSVSGGFGINLIGGTVKISGGSVGGYSDDAIQVNGGTVKIFGGTLSGFNAVADFGGTVTLSGGSISATRYGVLLGSGTLTVSGCGLTLTSTGYVSGYPTATLTGTLADGTPISTPTLGIRPGNLHNDCQNAQGDQQ